MAHVFLKEGWPDHPNPELPVTINFIEENGDIKVIGSSGHTFRVTKGDIKCPPTKYCTNNIVPYYKGKESLYKFAEEWNLNSWEFDIVKRICRCRHKGHFKEDLMKTKGIIDIYLKEHNHAD